MVCLHGVFFTRRQSATCPCMNVHMSTAADWQYARWMPVLSHDTKSIAVVPFNLSYLSRIGVLRAEARRL
eukprot:8314531-Karenia_brevis.AAC.1